MERCAHCSYELSFRVCNKQLTVTVPNIIYPTLMNRLICAYIRSACCVSFIIFYTVLASCWWDSFFTSSLTHTARCIYFYYFDCWFYSVIETFTVAAALYKLLSRILVSYIWDHFFTILHFTVDWRSSHIRLKNMMMTALSDSGNNTVWIEPAVSVLSVVENNVTDVQV